MLAGGAAALALLPFPAVATPNPEPSATYRLLMQDILINADLWSETPEILSASYGFEGITGVPGNKQAVIDAGGAWQDLEGYENPPYRSQTAAATPAGIAVNYGYPVFYADALPVVFSWPVLPSTVRPQDFLIHLNTGEIVRPEVASIVPNQEYNERNTVVIFGEFGNRLPPGTDGAIYPVKVEIAPDAALQLYGKQGAVSAAGLSRDSGNPYTVDGGPTLVGAKLSRMSTLGEGAPAPFAGQLPNDGVTLYGEDAQFRLRVLTTGGFSPDGVTSLMPDAFSQHFRLRLEDNGNEIWITQANVEYTTSLGNIIVLGLADLGPPSDVYDPTYQEDHDNQIDIILKGPEAAMRLITHVDIPASGEYLPFYNPGGPGMEPTPGVTYTSPGPAIFQPVTLALDDPMTVTYRAVPEPSSVILIGLAALLGGAAMARKRGRR